jgi:cobalt-zinc-cadmium resistance protein CzcA
VPLYFLADVELKDGPNQIQREDAKRRIVIGFNVRDRDVQSIVQELQQKVGKKIKFPPGYYVTYGGAFENLQAAKDRLMIAVPISLLLIFLLLYFAFHSLRHALLIYSAIPLSAIGGILLLAIRGMPFSISAGIGFIALFGVAVLNGIVLIAEFNQLQKEGITDMSELVLKGTRARLRPVLMTALVASLGFLPMAISNGAGAEVQRPLATVVIGGLLLATLLTLYVLPILYMLFQKKSTQSYSAQNVTVLIGLVVMLSVFAPRVQAQKAISLPAAIDSAIRNNAQLKNEQLKATYQQKLIETATLLPQTQLSAELGNYNSAYTDNRFSIGQSIQFPTVYSRQKQLLEQEWKQKVLSVSVKEAYLRRDVSIVFYQMLYQQQKRGLLLYADSLYSFYLEKAGRRLASGESDLLEKTSAQNLLGNIRQQLQQLAMDEELLLIQLQVLINTTERYQPAVEKGLFFSVTTLADTAFLSAHPVIQSIRQQQQLAMATYELEKSKRLPNLSLNYNTTTIRGIGADDKLYDGSTRFGSVQLGIGIPVFGKAQKNMVEASRFSTQIAERNYQTVLQEIQAQYVSAVTQYLSQQKAVRYYQTEAIPNAQLISETASRQLLAGSIHYLDWVQLINQTIQIKNEFLEAGKRLNESIIQLQFLTAQ